MRCRRSLLKKLVLSLLSIVSFSDRRTLAPRPPLFLPISKVVAGRPVMSRAAELGLVVGKQIGCLRKVSQALNRKGTASCVAEMAVVEEELYSGKGTEERVTGQWAREQ